MDNILISALPAEQHVVLKCHSDTTEHYLQWYNLTDCPLQVLAMHS